MNATIRTFDTMLSSHIHMKVCTPQYHSVSDLSLWGQPLTWDNVFCILSFIICFNYYRLIVRFSPSCNIIDCCNIWHLLTSHGKLYSASFGKKKIYIFEGSVRPPRIRTLAFHLIPTSFFRKLKETTPTVPNSYRALVCLTTLPTVICLI